MAPRKRKRSASLAMARRRCVYRPRVWRCGAGRVRPALQCSRCHLFPSVLSARRRRARSVPSHIAADAAYDYWYVYETVAHRKGIAAIPLNTHGHEEVPRDPDGTPYCSKGLRIHPVFFFRHTNGFRAQRFRCPLLFPQRTGEVCTTINSPRPKAVSKIPIGRKAG